MKTGRVRQRIISIFVIWIVMLALLRFSKENTGEEAAKEALSAAKTEEAALPDTGEMGLEGGEEAEKEERGAYVSGAGIAFKKSLSEEVAAALENGDTKSLVGIDFGELFDYELYQVAAGNKCKAKEGGGGDNCYLLFEGKGHRFSGFYAEFTDGRSPFLGIEAHDPVFLFLEVFGKPDVCEVWDPGWSKTGLRAEWYFEKAVLIVYEWDAEISRIEYKALGDAADGDGTEIKYDFDRRMESISECERAEAVYRWEGDTNGTEKYDTDNGEEAVKQYLQEQGFNVLVPDSSFYDEEEKIYGECYVDRLKERYCFVICINGDIAYVIKDLKEAGEPEHLIYRCDETGTVVQETQYDAWGIRMAEAFYKYYDGIPFPFLTKDWNLGYYDNGSWTCHLCRNQKTWFPEKNVWINDKGRVKTLNGDGISDWKIKSFFMYDDTFKYRADGKLRVIQEEIPLKYLEEAEEVRPDILEKPYFGEMEFQYDRNEMLKKIDYFHSDWDYGTWDQSGYINFDNQERMIHNRYYVTHGYHSKFYFYHEEEERPRVIASWCWGYGFEDITVYQMLDET